LAEILAVIGSNDLIEKLPIRREPQIWKSAPTEKIKLFCGIFISENSSQQ